MISLSALPAAASGRIVDAKTQSAYFSAVTEVDYSGPTLPWLLQGIVVVTIAIDSSDQVITPPDNDWVVVYSEGIEVDGQKFMAATFYRNYSDVASHGTNPYRFTWVTGGTMTSGYTSFANATTIQAISATPTLTVGTSVTAGGVSVTSDGGVPQNMRQLMWAGAWGTAGGAGLTAPPSLPSSTQGVSASVSNAQTGIGQFYGSFPAPNPQVVGPASGTLSAPRPNMASMLVIY